jgi:hypothetical protein
VPNFIFELVVTDECQGFTALLHLTMYTFYGCTYMFYNFLLRETAQGRIRMLSYKVDTLTVHTAPGEDANAIIQSRHGETYGLSKYVCT